MPKPKIKFASYLIITILLTLGFSISLQSLLAAWTAPAASPPASNVNPPIYNEGTPTNLAVNDQFTVNSNFYVGASSFAVNKNLGRVGIATNNPQNTLDVNGSIKSSDLAGLGNRCVYANASGILKVKTSDCNIGGGNYLAKEGTEAWNSLQQDETFTFEGSSDSNLLYIDANNNQIGINKKPSGINSILQIHDGNYLSLGKSTFDGNVGTGLIMSTVPLIPAMPLASHYGGFWQDMATGNIVFGSSDKVFFEGTEFTFKGPSGFLIHGIGDKKCYSVTISDPNTSGSCGAEEYMKGMSWDETNVYLYCCHF